MTQHRENQAVRLLNEAAREQYDEDMGAVADTSALIGHGYAQLVLAEAMNRLAGAIETLVAWERKQAEPLIRVVGAPDQGGAR